jgi:hypothetical protein
MSKLRTFRYCWSGHSERSQSILTGQLPWLHGHTFDKWLSSSTNTQGVPHNRLAIPASPSPMYWRHSSSSA